MYLSTFIQAVSMCLELMAHRSFRVADKETPLSYTDDCTEAEAAHKGRIDAQARM